MKTIGNTVTYLLSFANVLGSIVIFLLTLYMNNILFHQSNSSPRKLASINHTRSNLRGAQLKLTTIKTDIRNQIPKINNKLFKNEEPPKKLRKLETSFECSIIGVLSAFTFFYSFILVFSFCSKDDRTKSGGTVGGEVIIGGGLGGVALFNSTSNNEGCCCGCCRGCCKGGCGGCGGGCNCNCGGGGGDGGASHYMLNCFSCHYFYYYVFHCKRML